jgi:hypothetical protein
MSHDNSFIIRLRDYSDENGIDENIATLLQAALATCAAPTFFDPVSIGDTKYSDGGLGANNPVCQVQEEAAEIWNEQKGLEPLVKCFVTIGTGNPGMTASGETIVGLATTITGIATESEATASLSSNLGLGSLSTRRYFRFNVQQGLQGIEMAEHEKVGVIKTAT